MKLLIKIVSIIAILCGSVKNCPDEAGCLECGGTAGHRSCLYCENSFFDLKQEHCAGKVDVPIEFCKQYNPMNPSECIICEIGYYVDDKMHCTKCQSDDCAFCPQQMCLYCKDKKLLDSMSGKCIERSKCKSDNCNICITTGVETDSCWVCDPNFSLDRVTGTCIPGIPNCAEIAKADDKTCTRCQFGFFITKDGACKENSPSSTHMWMLWVFLGVVILGLVGYFGYQKFQKLNDSHGVYLNA
jgi:hypothetical protein